MCIPYTTRLLYILIGNALENIHKHIIVIHLVLLTKLLEVYVLFRAEITLKISTVTEPENRRTVCTEILILTQMHKNSIELHVQ